MLALGKISETLGWDSTTEGKSLLLKQ